MATNATKLRFLTASQVKRLYITVIASAEPTQPNLLQSAVDSPINTRHYAQETNIFRLAATLSEKIMKNHAFSDGNKRVALVAADMFLKINGYKLEAAPLGNDQHRQGLADAHVAVTTGQWDTDALSQYYQQISTPVSKWTPEILAYRSQATEY